MRMVLSTLKKIPYAYRFTYSGKSYQDELKTVRTRIDMPEIRRSFHLTTVKTAAHLSA